MTEATRRPAAERERHDEHELTDRQFELIIRRLADDLRYGQDASRYLGPGVDYVQSRPFVDGDPVRQIDWPLTARTGRYYVKQYESPKTTPVYLLIDTSASMAVSSRPLAKQRLAALVAGGLALAALDRLSAVGMLAAGSRQAHSPPSLRRAQVLLWLNEIRRTNPAETTRLAERLDLLGNLTRSQSLLIVISDMHDPGAVAAIKRAAQRHELMAIELEDPAERGRLGGGVFRGVEAETGRRFVAHGRSRWFRNPQTKRDALKAAGVDHLLLATDRPFVAPLRRFLLARGGLFRNKR